MGDHTSEISVRDPYALLEHFDLHQYAESFTRVKYTSSGEASLDCPDCGGRNKLYLNNDNKRINCFKCGLRDPFKFIALIENTSRREAINFVEQQVRGELSSLDFLEEEEKDDDAEVPSISLPGALEPISKVHEGATSYLESRGLTEQDMGICRVLCLGSQAGKEDSVVFNPHGKVIGSLRGRFVIPIYHKGSLVSWQARVYDPNYSGKQKYINAPGSNQKHYFWPDIDPKSDLVILVEGIFDALACNKIISEHTTYCTFGKSVSKEQLDILRSNGVKGIILNYDLRDAKDQMVSLANRLKKEFEVYFPDFSYWEDEKKDTGDCLGDERLAKQLRKIIDNRILINHLPTDLML